jgi:DNA helicase-2/ATP-dependent DNA helicase PcrA
LAVTFTKKAAGEMQSRLESIMSQCFRSDPNGNDDDEPVVEETQEEENESTRRNIYSRYALRRMMNRVTLGTFHHVCVRILRQHAEEMRELPKIRGSNLDGKFIIIDSSEQLSTIKQCLRESSMTADIFNVKQPKQLLNMLSRWKLAKDQEDASSKKPESKREAMERSLFESYCSKLRENNWVDFDDLLIYTRDLLYTNTQVRNSLRQRWTHVLIDEFQDTSKVQLDLVKALATTSLFVVGDSDQSIYSWRGADVNSMNHFVDLFSTPSEINVPIQTVKLMENYRSNMHIVKAAQRVIAHNKAMDRYDMIPMRGAGPKPKIFSCEDSDTEATFVVRRILEENFTPSTSIAILYRTNAQSRAIEEKCVAQNLKYIIRGSAGKFYNRAEVKDCLCFLRLIYNGQDRGSFIRSTKVPPRGIGEVAIQEFFNYYENVVLAFDRQKRTIPTYFDVLLSLLKFDGGNPSVDETYPSPQAFISKRAFTRLVPFAQDMKIINDLAMQQTVSELLGSIIGRFKLKEHFESEKESDRWENVMELVNAANRFDSGPSMSSRGGEGEDSDTPLGSFLDDIALLSDVTGDDESKDKDESKIVNDRVTANLMTIHASKGMEFDVVFVVGNEEGTFPTQRAIQAQRTSISQNGEQQTCVELEEERRLMYVAMTRAMNILILTWRRSVNVWFKEEMMSKEVDRSRFLDPILKNPQDSGMASATRDRSSSRSNKQSTSFSSSDDSNSSKQINSKNPMNSPTRMVPSKSSEVFRSRSTTLHKEPWKQIWHGNSSVKERSDFGPSRANNFKKNVGAISGDVIDITDDSSLFYPIGSKVIHKIHGEGTVTQNDSGQSMKVSVKFDGGLAFDFPIENNGLRLKL